MEVVIKTDAELLAVIRSNISFDLVWEVTNKFLDVRLLTFKGITKDMLVKLVEDYINNFGHIPHGERPLFLQQKQLEFRIQDFYGGINNE